MTVFIPWPVSRNAHFGGALEANAGLRCRNPARDTARDTWTRMVLSAPHTFALVSPGSFADASLAMRMGGVAARPHR